MLEAGKELVTLVESTLSMNIPPFQAKGTSLSFYLINLWKDVLSSSLSSILIYFQEVKLREGTKAF